MDRTDVAKMGTELALYRRIDEILFYKWDPIGISDTNWARNEYEPYLPQVFSLAMASETPDRIAEYLTMVATEYMSLPAKQDHDRAIAELILAVKAASAGEP